MNSLPIGARVGPYEVTGVIGAGGMGEVYRARDTRLQRDVAIKVLPAAMANHPRRLLRFEREARALAALNHPNIAAVYAVEGPALVMELVDGEDLSVRLRRGPLPVPMALDVARQVAAALAAAHDAGIVHRDLKPANIKLRADGTVKVLDFGLAMYGPDDPSSASDDRAPAGEAEAPWSSSSASSASGDPERTLTLTADGAALGTAAYMAPEQASGGTVDKRADIWSFGVVLFEILAGRRPFDPEMSEPAWAALPLATPESVRRVLRRCLVRDRRNRLRDIGDVRFDLDELDVPPPARPAPARWPMLMWIAAIGAVAFAVGRWLGVPAAPAPVPMHVQIDVAPADELQSGGVHPTIVLPPAGARRAFAWSPDGGALAFIGQTGGVRRVYVRDFAADAARVVPGTEGALSLTYSPDGSEIAFWDGEAIQRLKVSGGPLARFREAKDLNGMAWYPSGFLAGQGLVLFQPRSADATGWQMLTRSRELVRHGSPQFLPGERAVIYTEYAKQWTSGDERVMALRLSPNATPELVLREAADAQYLPTGHLAFLRQGTLFVVGFDVDTLKVRGEPVPVVKDVAQASLAWDSSDLTLAGQYSVSAQGALAYVSSRPAIFPERELIRIDRQGRVSSIGAPVRGYRNHVELSPDGRQLAVTVQTAAAVQMQVFDLASGRLARVGEGLPGEVIAAAWSRDNALAAQVVADGQVTAMIVRPGTSAAPRLVANSVGFWAASFSSSGRLAGMFDGDIWLHSPLTGEPPVRLAHPGGEDQQPVWSPDGQWVAFSGPGVSRQPEIYVQLASGSGEAIAVSTHGGQSPAWNPAGHELFYVEPGASENRMMVIDMTDPAHPGRPRPLFVLRPDGLIWGPGILTPFAVARDGQSFYGVRQVAREVPPVTGVHVIFNWLETVKAVAPVR